MSRHTPTLIRRGLNLQQHYHNVPFHNFAHALYVTRRLVEVLELPAHELEEEIFTTFAHDADREWVMCEDDEERAFQLTSQHITDFGHHVCFRVDDLIMATVFKDRPRYARIGDDRERAIADADISNVGDAFGVFLRESAKLCLEASGKNVILDEDGIIDFFEGTMTNFFPFLERSSGQDQPFITQRAISKWADNYKRNKDRLGQLLSHDEGRQFLIDAVYTEAKLFYGDTLTN